MVCLVCIDLVVVVGVWVSGFLVPSHYLVLSPLLPISTSTWYFYPYLLLLTLALTSGTSTLYLVSCSCPVGGF